MRKLFFIAVAGLLSIPAFADDPAPVPAPGTGVTTTHITCDVLPWTEVYFDGNINLTMTPTFSSHHAQSPSSVDVMTNDEVTLTLTGGDLTRTANDDIGGEIDAPVVTWGDTAAVGASGTWFAKWDDAAANVLDIDEGIGATTNREKGFVVNVDATPDWWDLLAGKYEGTLTLTVTAQ